MQTDDAARTIASKKRPHESSDVFIMGHVNKVRRRPNTRRREWQVWWEGTDETTWVPEERVPAELVREHYQPLLCWSAHQTRKAMVARDDADPSHAGLPPAAATPDDHDDETVYAIDRLVCGKRDPDTGGWVWRVRWDEYAAEHDTFEPEDQIPAAAVREFDEDLLRAVG